VAAERFFQGLGSKTDQLVPPEFDRSTGRWLDVCHPSHHSFHDSCHVLIEKNTREQLSVCVEKEKPALQKEIYPPTALALELFAETNDVTSSYRNGYLDLLYKAELRKVYQACRSLNRNHGKKYLWQLTSSH